MSTQRILPFPCRKSRTLAVKLTSVTGSGKCSAVNAEENNGPQRALNSISNMQTGIPSRSIMHRPKSPRKKVTSHEDSGGWTGEDILNAIMKLSPCSPIHHMREKLMFEKDKNYKTSIKGSSIKSPVNDRLANPLSPTRAILSPIRALSLNSPGKPSDEEHSVNAKRSKVLRQKLLKISDIHIHPPEETPSRTRSGKKVASQTPAKSSKQKVVNRTPSKPIDNKRVTRSARKAQKQPLYDDPDEEKENIKPGDEDSPSPRKRSRPSPEPQKCWEARRALLPTSPGKVKRSQAAKVKVKLGETDANDLPLGKEKTEERVQNSYSPAKRVLQLHRPEGLAYQETKRVLHSSVPDQLVGREVEIQKISDFVATHVSTQKAGSLYISGAPGTGKSACLMKVLNNDKVTEASSGKSIVISVNCMSMRNSTAIYTKIATELGAKPSKCKTARTAMKYLESALTSGGRSVILLLDEMDQLDSKNQEVLYTIFEWPALDNSRLLLIGIANALDLTDRILPRLQARSICRPTLINFKPYTKDQIVAILEARILQTSKKGERVIDPMAVQFCARKVAAVAGDARKALDVCRRAVEVIETDVMSQHVLSPSKMDKGSDSVPLKKVGLAQISGVISGVYESSISSRKPLSAHDTGKEEESFPLQQKLAVCTLILLSRHTKCKEVTLGKLHEAYSKICKKRQVTAVGQSEFLTLMQLIETRGIVYTKTTKQIRLMKISLALQEKDVEYALQDKTLLSAILMEGLPK